MRLSRFHHKPISFVDHLDINIMDLQRSLEFYVDLLGFRLLEKSDRRAVLTADGRTPLVTLHQPESVVAKHPRTTGLYHFAILLPSRVDLANALLLLHRNSYPIQGASDHLVSEALYLADPDGNGIEFYVDRPAASWRWNGDEVKMATIPLDIEELLFQEGVGEWQGLPADTLMGHIHLHVSELKRTEEFYTKGLGLDVVCRYGSQALFVSSGRYHHHIGLNTWNGLGAPAPAKNSVGLRKFSLVLPDEETRQQVIAQLEAFGARVRKEEGIYLTQDPSGNRVELKI